MKALPTERLVEIVRFLLDERRLTASDQAFLNSIMRQAEAGSPCFTLSIRQQAFWDTIIDDHEHALIKSGLVEDWPKP